ncbi:hypothetical protein KCP75_01655 [Salmonella enterica subsp. enterica]|nr:hypothetical protein KCP75_01655 [Salmonella enterica subsp. enterica]
MSQHIPETHAGIIAVCRLERAAPDAAVGSRYRIGNSTAPGTTRLEKWYFRVTCWPPNCSDSTCRPLRRCWDSAADINNSVYLILIGDRCCSVTGQWYCLPSHVPPRIPNGRGGRLSTITEARYCVALFPVIVISFSTTH